MEEVREKVSEKLERTLDVLNVVDDVHLLVDAELFRDLFGLAGALTEPEVQLWLRDDGLAVRQMDIAHIALTDLFVPKQYFGACKPGKVINEIRVDIRDIDAILARLVHGDMIDFSVITSGKLRVEVRGKRIRRFDLPLFNPEVVERRKPALQFMVHAKVALDGLLTAIEDAQKMVRRGSGNQARMSDMLGQVIFTTGASGIKMEANSEDQLYASGTDLTMGWDVMYQSAPVGAHTALSISILSNIIRAVSRVTNMVYIEYSTDMPMAITVELPLKDAQLSYWIAPRIEKDYREVTEK